MGKAHVLAICVPAQGHVIPLMELSVSLAKHGFKITFVNSESAHKLVVNASSAATKDDDDDDIALVSIRDGDHPEILKQVIENINATAGSDKITCVLADPGLSWAMEVAHEMKIRRAILSPFAATLLADKILEYALRCNKSMKLADKILCNSNYNLEPAAFEMNPKILPVGPLLTSNRTGTNTLESFNAIDKQSLLNEEAMTIREDIHFEDSSCLKWLDQQATKSVMYVAFGSLTTFDQAPNSQNLQCRLNCATDHSFGWIQQRRGRVDCTTRNSKQIGGIVGNEKYRANALDIKEKLRNSIKQGGCSSSNFISFVEWFKE
ncbi:hypothetical protein EZV62_003447 [Acer yangbiense]|uniref:UDP-glycosyltransferases domain-containing protein n=1 Tax=Acer yangbiense TaxID=1000413 RepID=A0A5C7IIL9_9ROSI|nr:hypothetical protein EZV62_003447 [Acer yangbiense]